MATNLTPSQCILLAVHFASSSDIKALHSFTPTRSDVLDPELTLRILLTYLPETLEPREYTTYVEEVASRLYLDVSREDVEVDTERVKDVGDEQARKKARKILKSLAEIRPPSFPPDAPKDLLTQFLCHRAYKIDAETGLLNLVPELVEPFLTKNDFIRTWYISVVLPLLRLGFEYYPDDENGLSLADWENVEGKRGIEVLMGRSAEQGTKGESHVARDIKGLVGPWMYGHTERKRRKVRHDGEGDDGELANMTRKISLTGVTEEDKTGHDWEYMFRWLVSQARENFPLIGHAVEEWDGPGDVDLGGFAPGNNDQYLDEDLQGKLEAQYAQAAFAACYAVVADTEETIRGAHAILARLAELLDFVPPPDLATSVESLPKIERHAFKLDQSQTVADLEPDALLRPEHPLTTPRMETYMLLQMIVYSAYQFAGLGYPISLVNVAKLHFYASTEEQLALLKRILRRLSNSGARRDESQWTADRAKLMWLWNWGIDVDRDGSDENGAGAGAGVLGKIEREEFEREMLAVFVETSCYDFASRLYLKGPPPRPLQSDEVRRIVLTKAMESYDGASNGNKTRGGMKKANDIISAFRPHFSSSEGYREAIALITATHSMSFYSLTLQHGVPFQPVSIRVSQDPLGLVGKVLEQNSGAYTQLDDLVGIGQNLVAAGLVKTESDEDVDETRIITLEERQKDAERRVTFMAVEAALRENDFETAYSYIVNRLTPSGAEISAPSAKKGTDAADDTSWRAAFLAGRYRPAASSPPSLRRLEQRTELLSLALLLAPASALTEILAAWRRCEEETSAVQKEQAAEEEEFDDRADRRFSASALPGNFTVQGEQPALLMGQKRREMGRMGAAAVTSGGKGGVGDEAPVSMFDLTRSAAQAFSRNAFPLRASTTSSSGGQGMERSMSGESGMEESTGSLGGGEERVRKRDMVANAASGALASGLGWMLGATPANQQQHQL